MAYGYIQPSAKETSFASDIVMKTLDGVEGIPYQFLPSVDRRVVGDDNEKGDIGRKYAEKIISRIPLLFLVPCQPLFMDDKTFSDSDRKTMTDILLGGVSGGDQMDLINGKGKYYSIDYAYTRYYSYLNLMLSAVASFLGLQNEKVIINGSEVKLGEVNWANECSDSFKTFFSGRENLVFYLDGLDSISESFSNSTTQSSLASQINGFSDTAHELEFLFGSSGSSALGSALGGAAEVSGSIMSSLASSLNGQKLGGGLINSLASEGVSTVMNGGKIVFPDIWSDSSFDRSYSLNLKLRSPDNDSLSIFLNVIKPYCKVLALVLPHTFKNNANGYRSPFLVKGYSKGLFNVDMGIITGLSVTKGASCAWNDDGLPTQIDISIDLADLYKSLAISGYVDDDEPATVMSSLRIDRQLSNVKSVVTSNTSYLDFLANLAGLNINTMEMGRRIKMYYYLTKADIKTIPSTVATRFDQSISKIMGKMYKTL